MRPLTAAVLLALARPALAGPTYDDRHPPPANLVEIYARGNPADLPPADRAALERYLLRMDPDRATTLQFLARFKLRPPDNETLGHILEPKPNLPRNMIEAIDSYLINKPFAQQSLMELRANLALSERALPNIPTASRQGYESGQLATLRNLIAQKTGQRPTGGAPNPPSPGPMTSGSTPGPSGPSTPPSDSGGSVSGSAPSDPNASLASMGGRTGSTGAGADGGGASIGADQRAAIMAGAKAGANGSAVGRLGGDLKSAFDATGKEAEGAMAGAGGGALAKTPRGGASPTSDESLAAAARSFGDAFKRNNLVVGVGKDGRPAILDASGRPATQAQRDQVLADIRSEPSALARDPNFFDPARGGVARDDFNKLKETYRSDPAARETDLKHVELTPPGQENNFTRSESCDLVSSKCNPHARASYKKGDDVPASDLSRIIASLRERLVAAGGRAGSARSANDVGGAGGRIRGFLSGLGVRWGGGPASSAVAALWNGLTGRAAPAGTPGASKTGARESALAADGASAPQPALASPSSLSPAGLAFFLLAVLGAALVAGAGYVLFKKDRKSWSR